MIAIIMAGVMLAIAIMDMVRSRRCVRAAERRDIARAQTAWRVGAHEAMKQWGEALRK